MSNDGIQAGLLNVRFPPVHPNAGAIVRVRLLRQSLATASSTTHGIPPAGYLLGGNVRRTTRNDRQTTTKIGRASNRLYTRRIEPGQGRTRKNSAPTRSLLFCFVLFFCMGLDRYLRGESGYSVLSYGGPCDASSKTSPISSFPAATTYMSRKESCSSRK